jgi:hypothetical protein
MFRKTIILILLGLTVLLGACNKELKPNEMAAGMQHGQIYYTQFSLFQENNNFRTTNYRKGSLIPVNTALTLLSIDSDKAELKLIETGQPLTIENVPKFTKDDMQTAFKKVAGLSKVNLKLFTPDEQAGILAGQVKKGMSKKAVLTAIGYPPQHVTPSLDSNDWTYWSNLFNRFIVHFNNGKVNNIVD